MLISILTHWRLNTVGLLLLLLFITECHKQHLVQGLQGCTHGDTQRFNHAQSLKRASEQFTLQPPAEDRQRFGRLNSLWKDVRNWR